MFSNRNKRLAAIAFVAVFLFMAMSPALVKAFPVTPHMQQGPYIDKIVFQVINAQDQRVLAMQAGTIDMDNSFFEPGFYDTLDADPNIAIFSAMRNGYGHITINCRDDAAPLNETVLRQAFAFAYDKTRVTREVMNGWSIEQDSLVPYTMDQWCIEDQLPYHYYDDQSVKGNQMLNDSGLFPFGADGWRTYKGAPIRSIQIEYSSDSEAVAGATARIGADALRALHIHADGRAANFNEYISRLDSHGAYDMVFFAYNFQGDDVSDLGNLFWSEYADRPYQNPCNFRNATFDNLRYQFFHGTTYEEVYNATYWMQIVLHQQVPRLVTYENTYNQAYRIDKFTGFVPDSGNYISGIWTMRNVHLIEGSTASHWATGGTLTEAISQEPDAFNIFTTNSAYSYAIIEECWPQLYQYGPDLARYPDLAESMAVETHSDDSSVVPGHTRFTIDILQNATWSDGTPLTANDVAFSYNYFLESYEYGNRAGSLLQDLESATAPTTYTVVLDFNTESYWHFGHFAYLWLIPEHIFNDVTGIGAAGWNTWNPVFDSSEPNVNCGPFQLTDFEAGEFYEVTYNPNFYYAVPHEAPTTTTTTPPPGEVDWTLAIVAGAVGAAVVILVGGFVLLRQK
jgi:ABC-type transport system substrate-binding protein